MRPQLFENGQKKKETTNAHELFEANRLNPSSLSLIVNFIPLSPEIYDLNTEDIKGTLCGYRLLSFHSFTRYDSCTHIPISSASFSCKREIVDKLAHVQEAAESTVLSPRFSSYFSREICTGTGPGCIDIPVDTSPR